MWRRAFAQTPSSKDGCGVCVCFGGLKPRSPPPYLCECLRVFCKTCLYKFSRRLRGMQRGVRVAMFDLRCLCGPHGIFGLLSERGECGLHGIVFRVTVARCLVCGLR